jgi:hypothetical protein
MLLIVVLIATALFAAGAYWWSSRRPAKTPAPSARAPDRFASVEIRLRSGACEPARALGGQRFLASRSPALPLAGCTKTRCDCSFAKLSDRRTDDRRWEHEGLSSGMFLKAERRKHGGRRDAD